MIKTKFTILCDKCNNEADVDVTITLHPIQFTPKNIMQIEHMQEIIPENWIFNKKTSCHYCNICKVLIEFYIPGHDDYSGENKNDYEFG